MIIYPPQSAVAFYIFNFPVRFYGLIMATAFFAGLFGGYFVIKKRYSEKLASEFLDWAPMIIIYSVFGARLFYVLGDFDFYLKNPIEIFLLNHGGLSIWGAVAFGIASIYFYSKKLKFNFLQNLDIFALFMPLCQSIGRWGNFFNQEAYGLPTNSFLKMYIDKYHRYEGFSHQEFFHPTFLYEMVLDLILFAILFYVFNRFKKLRHGVIACIYLIMYGFIRIAVERIRIDSVLYVNSVPIAVLISIFAIIFASFSLLLIYARK